MGTQPQLTGLELRDKGISAAVGHAESEHPSWSAQANKAFKHFLHVTNGEFLCEDFIKYVEKYNLVPPPPDKRAWGGVLQSFSRRRLIKKAGYTESKVAEHHCAPKAVWIQV